MKKLLIGILVVGSLFSFAGCGNKEKTDETIDNKNTVEDSGINQNKVELEEAKEIALKHAGFTANEVTFSRAEMDNEAGDEKYEIEFTHNGEEYDYEVDFTGKILKSEKESA